MVRSVGHLLGLPWILKVKRVAFVWAPTDTKSSHVFFSTSRPIRELTSPVSWPYWSVSFRTRLIRSGILMAQE